MGDIQPEMKCSQKPRDVQMAELCHHAPSVQNSINSILF